MKNLTAYSGFRLESVTNSDNFFFNAIVFIDGIRYTGHLTKTCTCDKKDPKTRKHQDGCNENHITNYAPGQKLHERDDFKILSLRRIHDYDDYELQVKIQSTLFDGWVSIDCTCGQYTSRTDRHHSHHDCQVKKKNEIQKSSTLIRSLENGDEN